MLGLFLNFTTFLFPSCSRMQRVANISLPNVGTHIHTLHAENKFTRLFPISDFRGALSSTIPDRRFVLHLKRDFRRSLVESHCCRSVIQTVFTTGYSSRQKNPFSCHIEEMYRRRNMEHAAICGVRTVVQQCPLDFSRHKDH